MQRKQLEMTSDPQNQVRQVYEDISPYPVPEKEKSQEETTEAAETETDVEKTQETPETGADIDILLEAQKVSGIVPENYQGEAVETTEVPENESEPSTNEAEISQQEEYQTWAGETPETCPETTADGRNKSDDSNTVEAAEGQSNVVQHQDANCSSCCGFQS